jgi:CRISPR/Cas system CSM-associated protein Csm3 (group 7 of RAMP superfamily)
MYIRRLNELRLTLQLVPAGPVLIKEGRHQEGQDKERRFFHRAAHRTPSRPRRREGSGYGEYDTAEDCFDMACVYSRTPAGDRFYLPGSSVRGVLRTTAERVVGHRRSDLARAADPFANVAEQHILDLRTDENAPGGPAIYRTAGPLDRCFGHTALRGRWVVGDAWMVNEQQAHVVVRDGVGIDRTTGAARTNVKFQFEALTDGLFETTLTLINYELWQLGLLAHVLAALDDGAARIGYGTRRGLGRIRLAVTTMEWRWYGMRPHQDGETVAVPTLAHLADQAGLSGYGCADADLSLALPLTLAQTFFGSTAQLEPARADSSDGFASTNWDAPPWAAWASLLPPVLDAWVSGQEVTP